MTLLCYLVIALVPFVYEVMVQGNCKKMRQKETGTLNIDKVLWWKMGEINRCMSLLWQ